MGYDTRRLFEKNDCLIFSVVKGMEYSILEVRGFGGPSTEPLHIATTLVAGKVMYSPESRTLQQCKSEIDSFYEEGKWDDYKKITNPYEYIFLSWNRRSSRSVATRQPLSRSYFKMIELWKCLELTEYLKPLIEKSAGLLTAHAAEGPGGFIEACTVIAEANSWNYKAAYAITLRSEAKNVPGWRKATRFLAANPQIHIHDGADGTGNILLVANQEKYVADVRAEYPDGIHLFTADGGFDFSNDYNSQEDTVFPLLLAEAILGLRVLAKGGCLIIKCFDTMEQPTIDLIWLLSRAFCEWGLVKPRTSRAGNAERYIIGRGFLGDIDDILDVLTQYQTHAQFKYPILKPVTSAGYRTLTAQVAVLQEKIEHMEIKVIQETLELIKSTDRDVIHRLVQSNVVRSIEWCREHREDISQTWVLELDKNVLSETTDLIHILRPPSNTISYSYNNWNHRSTIHLSFDGFRTGEILTPPVTNNPFVRLKGTKFRPA